MNAYACFDVLRPAENPVVVFQASPFPLFQQLNIVNININTPGARAPCAQAARKLLSPATRHNSTDVMRGTLVVLLQRRARCVSCRSSSARCCGAVRSVTAAQAAS
jgi:hypothetical protein